MRARLKVCWQDGKKRKEAEDDEAVHCSIVKSVGKDGNGFSPETRTE